ncbi:MAG TPA: hypothetical protein DCP31_25085 [Cyanobacteria bacterium UBA8543]|nr:hypothetical protein [Cyanobacteria bacterium UBA8543]
MAIFKILLVEDDSKWESILRDKLQLALRNMGHEDNPIEIAKSFESASNAHALLIGIAAYNYIHPLSKTTFDAQDLYNTLPSASVPEVGSRGFHHCCNQTVSF